MRGLLGEPDRLDYVDLRKDGLTVMLRFGDLPVAIHWIDLPGYHALPDGVRVVRARPAG